MLQKASAIIEWWEHIPEEHRLMTRDKWMKYYLINNITFAVFLIVYHFYFVEAAVNYSSDIVIVYIIVEIISVITLVIHCVYFPRFVLSVSETGEPVFITIIIFMVPAIFLFFVLFTLFADISVNDMNFIQFFGDIIFSAVFLLILVFHVVGLVKWRKIKKLQTMLELSK